MSEFTFPENPLDNHLYFLRGNWYEYKRSLNKWVFHVLAVNRINLITNDLLPDPYLYNESTEGYIYLLGSTYPETEHRNKLALEFGNGWKYILPDQLKVGLTVSSLNARIFWNGTQWYFPLELPKVIDSFQLVNSTGVEKDVINTNVTTKSNKLVITVNARCNKPTNNVFKLYMDGNLIKAIPNITIENYRTVILTTDINQYDDVNIRLTTTTNINNVLCIESVILS